MQHRNKHQVHQHVGRTGDGQVDQGAFGIPRCPKNGRAEVIQHGKGNAGEIDLHVHAGQRQYRVRRTHALQEIARAAYTQSRQDHAAEDGGGNGGMDGSVYHILLPAAQSVGYGNAGAHRQSDEKIHHQIGQGAGSAHSGHRNTATEPAHHNQIRRIEQQLEQAGQNDRDGIFDNAPKQRAMEHIILVFHRASLPLWNFYLLYLPQRQTSRAPLNKKAARFRTIF